MAQENRIVAPGEEPSAEEIVLSRRPDEESCQPPPLYGMIGRNHASPHVRLDAQMAAIAEAARRETSKK